MSITNAHHTVLRSLIASSAIDCYCMFIHQREGPVSSALLSLTVLLYSENFA